MSRLCAVLGDPIEHSLSPALHTAAYAELGLGWGYQRHRVDAAGLAAFVAGLDERWRGLSLTMPLKEAVLALGEPDQTVRLVGAANTLLLDAVPQLRNTDVGGLQQALTAAGATGLASALLLGTGATARSALVALAGTGVRQVSVLARTPSRGEPLRRLGAELGCDVSVLAWPGAEDAADLTGLAPPDVTVSTVVAGAADPLAPRLAEISPVVFDVVYDPWPTVLAATAARAGRTVLSGLDLLVHQAVAQVELMTGLSPTPAVLLSAGRAALGRPRSTWEDRGHAPLPDCR